MKEFPGELNVDHYQRVAYFGYPDTDGIGSCSSRRVIVTAGDENSVFIYGIETNEDGGCLEDCERIVSTVFRVSEMRALRIVVESISGLER